MHLAIRVEGGPEIGYGHLIRSNALGEELLKHGHKVTVATATPQTARSIFSTKADIIELPSREIPDPFIEWLEINSADVVFTDSYLINTEYQCKVREQLPLAVLQDDAQHHICADVFTNGNLYADKLDYEYVGLEPEICLGTDYVLLRREIREMAQDKPPWREKPERAIVMMGGSDIANLTPTVIQAFDGFDLRVDAIVGPGFSSEQAAGVRDAAADVSANVIVSRDPDDLFDRIFQADFAVSTSSSTTYELLALGTPVISIPVADNQELIANALQKRNLAIVLNINANKMDFKWAFETYVNEIGLRKKRRKLGMKLVDGRGTKRVQSELVKLNKE